MTFMIRNRTDEDIQEFLTWTFDGIYSFYDNSIQQEKIDGFIESVHDKRAFTVVNAADEVVGNCEFFNVGDEGEEILAVGVQMKPSLTGKGNGAGFIHAIVEQGRSMLGYDHLELAVADFNERAINVYEKEGFQKKAEFQNEIRGKNYRFIIMFKDW
ncbi:GNAT family N-acetyltransferase [Rossellomorea aquimaris]|uniref:GNAT family N-acetyltransferase n=1 Tax=Rossellomorea aquimaris TaxID=189382 RepID=UPI0007D0A8FF|nr:GNAT family protein [Rossellomorea aquimaris]